MQNEEDCVIERTNAHPTFQHVVHVFSVSTCEIISVNGECDFRVLDGVRVYVCLCVCVCVCVLIVRGSDEECKVNVIVWHSKCDYLIGVFISPVLIFIGFI